MQSVMLFTALDADVPIGQGWQDWFALLAQKPRAQQTEAPAKENVLLRQEMQDTTFVAPGVLLYVFGSHGVHVCEAEVPEDADAEGEKKPRVQQIPAPTLLLVARGHGWQDLIEEPQ